MIATNELKIVTRKRNYDREVDGDIAGKIADAIGINSPTATIVGTSDVGIKLTAFDIPFASAASEKIPAIVGGTALPTPIPATTPGPGTSAPPSTSPSPSTNTIGIGMNTTFVNYYGSEYPFLDRFKTSRPWAIQGSNALAAVNANGYPTSLAAGQNVYTIVGVDPAALAMPDNYVLTYTGTANFYANDATIVSSKTGEIVFKYTGTGNNMVIIMSGMAANDPIVDMHVVRQDQVALYNSGEIFNPAFLDKASQWSEIRYMDWGNINNNTLTSWDQRTTLTSASWANESTTASVPIEIMVALANKTHTDMWINIPAEADNDYVRKTLEYVRNNLAADLKVKVEYSNEVWNFSFQQASYSLNMANQLWGTDINGNGKIDAGTAEEPTGGYLQYYGYRAAQIAAIANSVFGSSAGTRLQNVISTQTGYLGLENYVFEGVDRAGLGSAGTLFKDYAVTTYFGLDSTDQATILSWAHAGQAGIDAAFAALNTSLTDTIKTYLYHQAVAARNGLALVAYEGGISLTANSFAEADQPGVLAFFEALDEDPRMGALYTKMVADFAASGGSGLNAYADAVQPGKYGTWGTLDSIYDETSQRYAALVAASQAAKLARLTGADPTLVDVRTAAASYVLGGNQLNLTYVGTGGFNGTGNNLANTITGGNSFNLLYGGGGNDTIVGGSRNDIIDGGTGADRMTGGSGDDTYLVDNAGDVVVESANGGIDEVRTTLNSVTLTANVENLTFTGTGPFLGTGNDLNNVITAAGSQAQLFGGDGNDTLNGSIGADLLNGGTGADIMRGGMGNDIYVVDNVGDRVTELAGGGSDTVRTTLSSYGLSANVENLTYVGTGNFNGLGTAADNFIRGGSGDDVLWGDAGNDTISGFGGNDTLNGGAGVDTMSGGGGDDRYEVDNVGDIVIELGGEGTDIVYSAITYTLTANVENLLLTGTDGLKGYGNELNNTIFGNAGNNSLFGYGGNDSIQGGGGNDMLVGAAGDDSLTGDGGDDQLLGGAGNDALNGGDGDDLMNGGAGRDSMTGGAGADRYVFLAGDTGDTRATADFVAFSHSDGDIIDLSKIDANIATAADDAFTFVGSADFTRKAGELRIQYSGGYWDVQGDVNGDGVADFSITVSAGSTALIARDFAL